jgi:hypothetical protein
MCSGRRCCPASETPASGTSDSPPPWRGERSNRLFSRRRRPPGQALLCKRLRNALSSISFVNDDVFYDCADTRRNSESDQGQHSDKITGSADRKHDRSRRLDDGLQLFPSRGLCRRGQLTDQSSDRIGHRWGDRGDFLDLKPSHLRSSGCRRRLRGSRARSGRPPRTSRACALPTPGSRPRPPVPACSTRRGPAPMSRLRP